jgi:hypothetical protein
MPKLPNGYTTFCVVLEQEISMRTTLFVAAENSRDIKKENIFNELLAHSDDEWKHHESEEACVVAIGGTEEPSTLIVVGDEVMTVNEFVVWQARLRAKPKRRRKKAVHLPGQMGFPGVVPDIPK